MPFAVARGVHRREGAEDSRKILAGAKTAIEGDFRDRFWRITQQRFRTIHAQTVNQDQGTIARELSAQSGKS